MPKRKLVIAAYDISSPRRLKRALEHCTGFATGGQKSVHECWVTSTERDALCQGLESICEPESDRWFVHDVQKRPGLVIFGRAKPPRPPPAVLFVG